MLWTNTQKFTYTRNDTLHLNINIAHDEVNSNEEHSVAKCTIAIGRYDSRIYMDKCFFNYYRNQSFSRFAKS